MVRGIGLRRGGRAAMERWNRGSLRRGAIDASPQATIATADHRACGRRCAR